MIRPSVGEPDHDLRAWFREAEKAFLLPRPGRHGKGDRRIGREGRIGLPVRREYLDVHGIARAEAFRGRPLPRRIGHGQHPRIAVKVQPRAEFREKPFDGPPDSLPHASASMPSVISCPEKRTVRTLSPLTTHPGRMDGIKVMTLPPVAKARENTACGISTGRSGQRESRQLPTKIFPSPCVCQT